MIILEEQTGLNAGLNRGLKIGKMLKKNVRLKNVSIKNAIKVGKAVAPIASAAMTFVPGGGVASKLLKGKVGKILTKVKNTKAVKFSSKIANSKVGKFAVNNIVKPTVKNAFSNSQIETTDPVEIMPNATPTPAQFETITEVKGVPAESITTGINETGEVVPNDAQLETISKVKDIPVENLKEEVQAQKELAQLESGALASDKPNYTIPIVIGVGAVGAILLVLSSKSN
jgi:hypothetical protein